MKLTMALVWLICAVAPVRAFADTVAVFTLPSGVTVRIVEAVLQESSFKITRCGASGGVCLINGRVPFGTAWAVPRTYVKSIEVYYQGKTHALDASDMYNAWENRPLEYPGTIRYFGGKCRDAMNCDFRGVFADAAAAYVAEWTIVDGVSRRNVITKSDDVVNLFIDHIDPPEFE